MFIKEPEARSIKWFKDTNDRGRYEGLKCGHQEAEQLFIIENASREKRTVQVVGACFMELHEAENHY